MNWERLTRRNLLAIAAVSSAVLTARQWGGYSSASAATIANLIQGKTFSGTRGSASGSAGGEGIRIAADGTGIVDGVFQNLATAVRIPKPISQLTIENGKADNLYRFLDTTVASGVADASLSDFVIRNVQAGKLEHGFSRLRYQSARGVIEDVIATCRDSGGDAYCVGFALDDQARDITYQRAAAHGFRESGSAAGSYWNGDGFTDERGNSMIRYLDCLATGCTDGGFDLKSAAVLLERCKSEGNKRNFRLWNSGELHDCESIEPVSRGGSGRTAHFSFHGDVGAYRIVRPKVRAREGNTAPVFLFNTNTVARLTIEGADIEAPSAALITVENGPAPVVEFVPARNRQHIVTAS
ncbi:hypothetical protein [Altererythrobacter sp. Root672]|uniref:hypothetical protein n=1 Tax=Altererythrobacter sp. Root672 TaxID=1736584 RepID=UPI0006FB98DF|nr:hypothetical protein [Altererythrobacter sp. Root672]KRA84451.1 hypothetical protein ASD76_10875 [Altererythrobacter sp. Root672]